MSNDSYEYGSNIAQPPVRPCDEYLDLDPWIDDFCPHPNCDSSSRCFSI